MNEQKTIIEILREPRIHIFDVNIAMFDLTGTILISYLIAKKLDWNPWITVGSAFPVAYLAHSFFKVETPLNKKINETFHK